MLTSELLAILCCPKCQGEIQTNKENTTITCSRCNLEFEVKENIPIMIFHPQDQETKQENTRV